MILPQRFETNLQGLRTKLRKPGILKLFLHYYFSVTGCGQNWRLKLT